MNQSHVSCLSVCFSRKATEWKVLLKVLCWESTNLAQFIQSVEHQGQQPNCTSRDVTVQHRHKLSHLGDQVVGTQVIRLMSQVILGKKDEETDKLQEKKSFHL